MWCSSGRIEGPAIRRLPVGSLVGSNGCVSDYSIGSSVWLHPMDVRPIILSIYRLIARWENYLWTVIVGVSSVRSFYWFMGLITVDGCLSDYSVRLSSDCQIKRIICRLSELVSRLSGHSICLSSERKTRRLIWLFSRSIVRLTGRKNHLLSV